MSNLSKSMCWAAAILLTAAGNALGLIADDVAQMLFVVLPIAAVGSLNAGGCALRSKGV